MRIADVHPVVGQRVGIELRAGRFRGKGSLGQGGDVHLRVEGAVGVHHRPGSFVPAHGCQEGLAPQQVVCATLGAEGQADQPPTAVGRFHQVGVPGALDGVALRVHIDVRQDGVGGIAGVRPVDVPASCDGHLVSVFRSAFRDEQVVPAVFLIDVRPFGIAPSGAGPDASRFGQLAAGQRVYLAQVDAVVRVAHQVALAILKVERGVDASLLNPHRLRPGAARVGGVHQEVAFVRHVRGNHVETLPVVSDGGGIDASPRAGVLQRQLRGARQHVPYLLPVHQVAAVEDGYAGEVLETAVDQVEVVAHAADARVGMETRDDGVLVAQGLLGQAGEAEGQCCQQCLFTHNCFDI